MNTVDPIRDKQKIQDMKIYLKGRNLRDYALFVVGIRQDEINDLYVSWNL